MYDPALSRVVIASRRVSLSRVFRPAFFFAGVISDIFLCYYVHVYCPIDSAANCVLWAEARDLPTSICVPSVRIRSLTALTFAAFNSYSRFSSRVS